MRSDDSSATSSSWALAPIFQGSLPCTPTPRTRTPRRRGTVARKDRTETSASTSHLPCRPGCSPPRPRSKSSPAPPSTTRGVSSNPPCRGIVAPDHPRGDAGSVGEGRSLLRFPVERPACRCSTSGPFVSSGAAPRRPRPPTASAYFLFACTARRRLPRRGGFFADFLAAMTTLCPTVPMLLLACRPAARARVCCSGRTSCPKLSRAGQRRRRSL